MLKILQTLKYVILKYVEVNLLLNMNIKLITESFESYLVRRIDEDYFKKFIS